MTFLNYTPNTSTIVLFYLVIFLIFIIIFCFVEKDISYFVSDFLKDMIFKQILYDTQNIEKKVVEQFLRNIKIIHTLRYKKSTYIFICLIFFLIFIFYVSLLTSISFNFLGTLHTGKIILTITYNTKIICLNIFIMIFSLYMFIIFIIEDAMIDDLEWKAEEYVNNTYFSFTIEAKKEELEKINKLFFSYFRFFPLIGWYASLYVFILAIVNLCCFLYTNAFLGDVLICFIETFIIFIKAIQNNELYLLPNYGKNHYRFLISCIFIYEIGLFTWNTFCDLNEILTIHLQKNKKRYIKYFVKANL